MKKKILIVDDNPYMLQVLQLQLEDRGYETSLATDGKQAVDMAAAQLPDIILMDIIMPGWDGIHTTRMIRQNTKTRSIPILAMTALDSCKAKEGCLNNGCDDYIAKPFTATQLASCIEKLLKQDSK